MFIGVDKTQRERNSRAHEQVHPLKNFCQLKKPNVAPLITKSEKLIRFKAHFDINAFFAYFSGEDGDSGG